MKNFDLSTMLPSLLTGDDFTTAMTTLPEYSPNIRELSASERLIRLTDIYRIFLPTAMTSEIYQRLYLMAAMSLKNKGNIASIQQSNANYIWSHGGEFHGVITGATSTTIIGDSGIGKTSNIQLAINALGPIIETETPQRKIIPVLMVSCPFDCNYRGLLCQILISIDEILGTNHYERVQKSRLNAQQILGLVCQVCHLNVAVLIIDEIQLLAGSHSAGTSLYKMILQLVNCSGINVLLVGTNECLNFFGQSPQIARRSVGLQYSALEYGADFRRIAEILYHYQYVRQESTLTDNITAWLYEHSGGIVATLISLIHDAQEIAIMKGKEALCIESLTEAYNSRMRMLHRYITGKIRTLPQSSSYKEKAVPIPTHNQEDETPTLPTNYKRIADIVSEAKQKQINLIELLKEHITVTEICL